MSNLKIINKVCIRFRRFLRLIKSFLFYGRVFFIAVNFLYRILGKARLPAKPVFIQIEDSVNYYSQIN